MKKLFFTLFSVFITMSAFAVTPEPLSVSASTVNICNQSGSMVNGNIMGGTPPYTCTLSPMYSGPLYNETTSQPMVFFNNVMSGSYKLMVTDASMQRDSTPVMVNSSGIVVLIAGMKQPLCNNGTGSVALVINPAPYSYPSNNYSYQINGSGNWISFTDMSTTIPNLPAGSFNIEVVDNSSGCVSGTNGTITAPAAITFTADLTQPASANDKGSAALTITGGTAPYSYDINNKNNYVTLATNKVIANLPLGKDTIYLKDANGCMAQNTQSFIVSAVTTGSDNAFAAGRNIKSSNKAVQIEQANGKQASLYDLNGALIYNEVLKSDKVIIPVKESGIYFVSIEGQTKKVLVK